MALSPRRAQPSTIFAVQEFCSQDGAWLLHEFVAVTSTFEYAWFNPAGAIGDFASGDSGEFITTALLDLARVHQAA